MQSHNRLRSFTTLIFVYSFTIGVHSACWRIEGFQGYSAKSYEKYQITPDGLGSQAFRLVIEENKAALFPSNGLACSKVSETSAVCAATDGVRAIVEVWTVDPIQRKAYQTHSRSGSGALNGSALFIGNVVAACD